MNSIFIGGVNGSNPDYPYYMTTQPSIVKKLLVPQGTKLTYGEISSTFGQQAQMMREDKLTDISLPETATIEWAGVPVSSINKYFNSEMTGFTVNADFSQLDHDKESRFSQMWQSCNHGLGIDVRDSNDWTFNKNNITDVNSCSVLYQRYFKQDLKQQKFLDDLLFEMKSIKEAEH